MLNFKKRLREISLKHSSLSGVINIAQTKKTIQFESSLERDFIFLLEFDKNVHQYLEQPLEILYKDGFGKDRKYTPDFAVSFLTKRRIEIVEIKYESALKTNREELKIKFEAARNYCKKNGYLFKVVTEKYIRETKGVELENYKFLARYRDYFSNINCDETAVPGQIPDLTLLHANIYKLNKCTIKELIDTSSSEDNKKAELIFLTWYLIASKLINVNFNEKLSLNSIIWVD